MWNWLDRNENIFQNKEIIPIQVGHQIGYAYGGMWLPRKVYNKKYLKTPKIQSSKAWDYFDREF